MDRFEKMVQTLANDNTVPDQVWEKYTDALRNLPEKGAADTSGTAGISSISAYPFRRTNFLRYMSVICEANHGRRPSHRAKLDLKWRGSPRLKYAAVLAASLCLIAGTAYAASMSGLSDYLSGFMGQSDVEDGLLGEPDEVTAQQEETGSFGNLWNITDTWYDGAKVYFYAETPEAVLEDGKLKVVHKDHMTVNGIDHLLNSEKQSDGVYLCWVDVSDIDDTETLELSIRLELLQNQYDWTAYPAAIEDGNEYDYATDVTVAEEQTLTFTVDGTSAMRKGSLETVTLDQVEGKNVDGDVAITEATISPSTLTLHFTYRLSGEDAKEMLSLPTMRGALFYIEDEAGNQIGTTNGYLSVFISESYTDEDGRLCADYELSGTPGILADGQTSLDTATSSLTIIPYEADWDEEGKLIPDTDRELGWGSFTVSFEY